MSEQKNKELREGLESLLELFFERNQIDTYMVNICVLLNLKDEEKQIAFAGFHVRDKNISNRLDAKTKRLIENELIENQEASIAGYRDQFRRGDRDDTCRCCNHHNHKNT